MSEDNEAKCLCLYTVNDRDQTTMCVVAAYGSEDAIDNCELAGFDWRLDNTVTRRIQRNIGSSKRGVLAIVQMHGNTTRFRTHLSVGKDHPNYNPKRRRGVRANG